MKRILRLSVCAVLSVAVLLTQLCALSVMAAEPDADFFSKVDMLFIESHLESDVGLGKGTTVQGACADGEYAYFAFMNGSVCNIAKYDAHTWEYLEKKQIVNMGHSNDMTYNPDKDYLVVANNAPYYDVITLVDPDTLKPIKDVTIDEDIYSISYNPKRKVYVVGLSGTYDFALLDEDFTVKKKFEGVDTGRTRQGGDCDDDYIYFVQSGGNNLLVVYDYSGEHIASIPMDDSDEVENIFHIGNTFYTSLYYYGNTLYRVGFSDASRIAYPVSYDAGGGEGEMKPTTILYGESTKLSPCTFTKEGYTFGGWRAQRTSDGAFIGYRNGASDYEWLARDEVYNDVLYDDEESIATTVRFGGVKLTATWIAERYNITLAPGEGAGEALSYTVAQNTDFILQESGFSKEGYLFAGYAATRTYDDRVYGYRADSDRAEWLRPEDAAKQHIFKAGDHLSAMTPEGDVTLTAQFKSAYTFGEDGSTLVEYVGVDEKVMIPANDGELKTLAEGAIKDNENMTELYIPAGVDTMHKQSITNCKKLRNIYFEGTLPSEINGDCCSGQDTPILYEIRDGQTFCIGFLGGDADLPIVRYLSSSLDDNLNNGVITKES